MNIVPTYPNISLNTANVNTETARRDNQLRELITPTKQSEAAQQNPAWQVNKIKLAQPGSSQLANQEALENKGEDNQRVEAKQQQEKQQEGKSKKGKNNSNKRLKSLKSKPLTS